MQKILTIILCLLTSGALIAAPGPYSVYSVRGDVSVVLPDGSREAVTAGTEVTFNTVLEIAEGAFLQILDGRKGLLYDSKEVGTIKVGTLVINARKRSENVTMMLAQQLKRDLLEQSGGGTDKIMGVSFRGDAGEDYSYTKEVAGAILHSVGSKCFSKELTLDVSPECATIVNKGKNTLFVNVLCLTADGPSLCLDFYDDGLVLSPGGAVQIPLRLIPSCSYFPLGTDQPLDTKALQRFLDQKVKGKKSVHAVVGIRL